MESMKPTLIVLAAGIGSRYGGLKQLDRIGPSGETIIDYSVYDALRAGFGKILFVIKQSIENEFIQGFVERLRAHVEIDYVFQEIWMVPDEFKVSDQRQKPWGTGHAVLMADGRVQGPFAVINADDFYGYDAYRKIADFFRETEHAGEQQYCMVGYRLSQTLSDHGSVSRGICKTDPQGFLMDVVERTHIVKDNESISYLDESGSSHALSPDEVVSMNYWGFRPSFFGYLNAGFRAFLEKNKDNPRAEFYIPYMVNELIGQSQVAVKVLQSSGSWFGMTYREDRDKVMLKIRALVRDGIYPENLWGL